jgi:hypothetical protein
LPARNRESARPGLDLGGRERRIVKIPAIQFLPVAIADRHRPRQQRAGGISLDVGQMAALGVRRDKAALSSGCKAHPAIRSGRKQSEQSWR